MASEKSVTLKSNLESGAIPEMPSCIETSESEESIARTEESLIRVAPAETNSSTTPPTQKKGSSTLPIFLSHMNSQLVSIYK